MGTFNSAQYAAVIGEAKNVFLPFKPIDLPDLFKGRTDVIQKLHDELTAPGRHAVLFGDRGVGKSSVALLMPFFLSTPDDDTHYVRCSATSRFDSISKHSSNPSCVGEGGN